MKTIGSRHFSQSDIDWFAAASGDYNPVHVDPVIARRLITAGTVVHGMYTVLWMLESHFRSGGSGGGRLTAYFPRSVKPGDLLELHRQSGSEKAGVHLTLMRGGETVATLVLDGNDVSPLDVPPPCGRLDRAAPDERAFSTLKGLSGQTPVAWDSSDIAAAFPSAASMLGEVRIAAFMGLSRLVGMQAPGLHSIFTGIAVSFDDDSRTTVDWRVSRASVAIAPIRITIAGGGLNGHVDAILRPAPVEQPPMPALQSAVSRNEFAGQRALVVGGSRGLGELVAKLVVAGGGEATISYLSGEADAQRVASEIIAWGGKCSAIRLDMNSQQGLLASLSGLEQRPSHLYYFPTPRITKRTTSGFDREAFAGFTDIYVAAFDRLVLALSGSSPEPLRIFYPSTSFIDELPAGFAEYAAAKAAGEAHCAYLNRTLKPVAIQVSRLPRLGTDQTASLIPQSVGSAVEAMLAAIRSLHDFAKPVDQQ